MCGQEVQVGLHPEWLVVLAVLFTVGVFVYANQNVLNPRERIDALKFWKTVMAIVSVVVIGYLIWIVAESFNLGVWK